MKRVSYSVTYPEGMAHPIHRGLGATPDVSKAELLMWGPTDSVTVLVRFDGPTAVVRDLFEAVDSTVSVDLVADDDGTYAFSHQTSFELPDPVIELVAESKVVFLPPVVFYEGGTATVEAAGRSEHLAAFHEGLSELLDVRIESVRTFRRSPLPPDVTDRQRRALETAVAVGYYDVPRTGSVEDVARELDCATSTAGELLRKAESAVVTGAVGDPGPGRPG